MNNKPAWVRAGECSGCGETHYHCTECGVAVPIDEPKRCAFCGTDDPRCTYCALEHYDEVHRRREMNRLAWEVEDD